MSCQCCQKCLLFSFSQDVLKLHNRYFQKWNLIEFVAFKPSINLNLLTSIQIWSKCISCISQCIIHIQKFMWNRNRIINLYQSKQEGMINRFWVQSFSFLFFITFCTMKVHETFTSSSTLGLSSLNFKFLILYLSGFQIFLVVYQLLFIIFKPIPKT